MRGDVRIKTVHAASGISKRRDDWGAGGDPIGATLAPRSPRVLALSPELGAAAGVPQGIQILSAAQVRVPRRGDPTRAVLPLGLFFGGFLFFFFLFLFGG